MVIAGNENQSFKFPTPYPITSSSFLFPPWVMIGLCNGDSMVDYVGMC